MKRMTYITERPSSAWFCSRLRKLFAEAGIEPTIVREMGPRDPLPVVSGPWALPQGVKKLAVMPFNEPIVPTEENKHWKEYVAFYVSQASHMLGYQSKRGMTPSATVDHPLCWMPEDPGNLADNRPFKFLVPSCGSWDDEHIAKLLSYFVNAIHQDLQDLSTCEFIVECQPFNYKPVVGEKVTFYDEEGVFLHRLLRSTAVVCLGPSCIMEMSYLASVAPLTGTLLFSEGLIDATTNNEPRSVLETMTRLKSYSHIKYLRAVSGGIQLDDPDMNPLFTFCSGSRTTKSTVIAITPLQMMSLMRSASGRDQVKLQELNANIQERPQMFKQMAGKLRALHDRLTAP